MKYLLFICTLLFSISSSIAATNPTKTGTQSLQLDYFGQQLQFEIDRSLILDWSPCAKDKCLRSFYQTMDEKAYQELLHQFEQYQKDLQLNDWMYYKLIRQSMEQLWADVEIERKGIMITLYTWFFMTKSGYETRLSNAALQHLFLYVWSEERPFDMKGYPDYNNKMYFNLTAYYLKMNQRRVVLRSNRFIPVKNGKAFSFKFTELPKLKPQPVHQTIKFQHDKETYELDLVVDRTPIEMMQHYPSLEPMDYVQIPISETLQNSLLPQLKELMQGKSQKESVEILLSFTRRAFDYKWDWDVYDDDKPMIAEEVLLSEVSDHEDRVALFYYLVKELIDVPMLVISHFNNNLTVAVALDEPVGEPIEFEGTFYTVCDPTTPNNSKRLGDYPNGLREGPSYVLGQYR